MQLGIERGELDALDKRFSIEQEEQEFDVRGYGEVLWRRRKIGIAILLAVTILGTAFVLHRRKIYSAQTQLVIAVSGSGGASGAEAGQEMISNLLSLTDNQNVDTQVQILNSPYLLRTAFRKMTPKERQNAFGVTDVSGLPPAWAFDISETEQSEVVNVNTQGYNPALAAKFSSLIVDTYLQADRDRNNQAVHQARVFIDKQLTQLRGQLSDASDRLAEYQRKSGIVDPTAQGEAVTTELFSLRADMGSAGAAVQSADASLRSVEADLNRADPELQAGRTIAENPEFAATRDQLSTLEDQLVTTRQEYLPNSQEVKKLQSALAETKTRLRTLAKSIVTSIEKERNPIIDTLLGAYANFMVTKVSSQEQLRATHALLDQRTSEYLKYPSKLKTFAEVQRQVDDLARTYAMLTDRDYELLITEQAGIPNAFVSSPAEVQPVPTSPNVPMGILASIAVGLMLALAVIAIVDRMDATVHDPQSVERMLGLPTLTGVPEATSSKEGSRVLLIDGVDRNHAFLESFRLLRNNIAFSSPDRELHVLAVTSAGKGEGKSTICANLAAAMGLDGKRVLLVDGDLRRPSLHTLLGISREFGFSNVITGTRTIDDVIVASEMENVWVMPSGPLPPRPTEFLNSANARKMVEDVQKLYDVVLIDSPPCTGLSDFQVISTYVDGVILVVSIDHTLRPQLMATSRMLRQASSPVLGVVLNRVTERWSPYGYYSYYYYYSYYGEDDVQGDTKKGKRKGKGSRKSGGQ